MKTKYYIVVDKYEKTIWGIGTTKEQAIKDAKHWVKESACSIQLSPAIECNKETYDFVRKNGAMEGDTWTVVNGVAILDKFLMRDEKKDDLKIFSGLSADQKLNKIYELLLKVNEKSS